MPIEITWRPIRAWPLQSDSAAPNRDGVYIIGYKLDHLNLIHTVYVGQGNIRNRLSAHVSNKYVLQYEDRGLFCTQWATDIHPDDLEGIELYLALRLKPLAGERWPKTTPIRCRASHRRLQ